MIFGYDFYGQESDWSSTQMVTVGSGEVAVSEPTPAPYAQTPTPTPTALPTQNPTATPIQPNIQVDVWSGVDWAKVAIVGLVLVVAVLAVGLVALGRRLPNKQERL